MSNPLIVPQDARAKAFRWLVAHLRADPDLKRVVDLWQVWDGTAKQDDPFPANRCAVRLTPMYQPDEPVGFGKGRRICKCPVLVRVEWQTADARQVHGDNPISLWGLVQAALPGDAATVAKANAGGISWWDWVSPGADAAGDVSAGTIRLVMFFRR